MGGQVMTETFLWMARRKAEGALAEPLKPYAGLLGEAFVAIDLSVGRLEGVDHPFGRVAALVLIKARNLALGCYSLSLDALAQEAGALFRPLIECLELLMYFRLDPTRIQEALEDRLPKAGVIAQRIDGKFKALRDFLNTHASHLSVSSGAMAHLVDFNAGRLRAVQAHNNEVLRQNLGTLLAVLVWLAIEGANCMSVGSGVVDDAFGNRVEDMKRRALALLDAGDP